MARAIKRRATGEIMTAESIAKALSGRKVGGGWMARCPGHDDRKPSLSIQHTDNGKVLVRCHAGCDQDRVISALRSRGLWPENGSHPSKRSRGAKLLRDNRIVPNRSAPRSRFPSGKPRGRPRTRQYRHISPRAVSIFRCRKRSGSMPV